MLRLQRLAARLALDAHELPRARSRLEAHDRWLAWSGAVLGRAEGTLLWASYHVGSGSPGLARDTAWQALAQASGPVQPLALLAVHRFLGRLNTESMRLEEAGEHLVEALRLSDACQAPFERARTLLELAELRAAQRRVEDARGLLDEVEALCTPLEADPTPTRAQALAARLDLARAEHQPNRPGSAREVEVLRLVAAGMTDGQVAERLFISRRTVNSHLRRRNPLRRRARAALTLAPDAAANLLTGHRPLLRRGQ